MLHSTPFLYSFRVGIILLIVGLLSNTTIWAQNQNPFSIVLLPDTQFYSEKYHDNYKAQTRFIREKADELNIQFVIHLGDIVQNENSREEEWEIAREAHRELDGIVPYCLAPGNHDMDLNPRNTSLFNKYFPVSDFEKYDWYGGHFGETNDNCFCFLDISGVNLLIVALEYNPRDVVLEWANQIIKKHANHRVIIATHCYMGTQGRNSIGNKIWEQLVSKHENIFMVVCGHVGALSLQTSLNDHGGLVYEILTDYQSMKNGGDSWLRTLAFHPKENIIEVSEFSPVLNKNRRDIFNNYRLYYNMTK